MARGLAGATAVASSVWGAALSLAAVPVYVSHLGIEAYGLIGFFITSQAILQVLDLGLAPAVNREMARSAALGTAGTSRTLLYTLARLYWITAIIIASVLGASASLIATYWLNASSLPVQDVTESLMLMGTLIAARWPIAVYQNTLIGMQRLGAASLLSAAMSTLSVGASVLTVTTVQARPQALFAVQAACSLLHALVIRWMAWRALGGISGAAFDLASIRRIWHFSLSVGGVILTGVALTQLDKALLSKMLPLASFGEYMLAATVVGGLSVLVGPLFNTIYPEFSALVAREQFDVLARKYHRDTRNFAVAFLPIVTALGLYGYDLVWLWTGHRETATTVAPVIALLCVGSAINGLMFFPYSLQLAHGLAWIPLAINVGLLVIAAPLIVMLAMAHGALGGAAAWALLEVAYLFTGTWITHRRIAAGSAWAWLGKAIAVPLIATAALAWMLRPLVTLAPGGSGLRAAAVAASVLISAAIVALCFQDLRIRMFALVRASAPTT